MFKDRSIIYTAIIICRSTVLLYVHTSSTNNYCIVREQCENNNYDYYTDYYSLSMQEI